MVNARQPPMIRGAVVSIGGEVGAGMVSKLRRHCRYWTGALARLRAAERGATAVEFALIAPAFLATLIAVLQTALFLFAQASLQTAATQAGRLFMTGQAQNLSQSAFKTQVCTNYLPAVFNCNNLIVVVQNYTSFSSANTSAPALYNAQGNPVNTWAYSPGAQGQVMVVQLVYPWSVVSGPLGFVLANLPNGAAEMMGISAFRVEPYGS
jgi:Flp pilus assembly protein TadG